MLAINNGFKLVRFAHNWNNGILELWNDGLKANRTQSDDYSLIFLFDDVFDGGKKQKRDGW